MDASRADPERFDAVIIGAGQAGHPLALAFDEAGWKTAVIERKHVGGSCVNFGCTPSKTLAASARVAYLTRHAREYGVQTGDVYVDMATVRQRKREMVERFRHGVRHSLEGAEHVDLIDGQAAFAAPHELSVALRAGGRRRITAPKIFINVGTRAARPSIRGLDQVGALDATSIMELDRLPDHLIVIGGGYIGLEFAQMFRRFGSRVSVMQRGPQLLPHEDADVAEAVRAILADDEIAIHPDTDVVAARRGTRGGVVLGLRTPDQELELAGSHLLVAVGTSPNTHDLALEAAGIATDDAGFVRVNERLETGVPGVYAMGDVKGGPAFTHVSFDDYRIVKANLLEGGDATTHGRTIPYVVFIDPELGRIGMTEEEARRSGRPVRVVRLPMKRVARAIESGETRGFVKAVVDASNGAILGCAVLGTEGGELMAMLQLAMMGGIASNRLREAVFAHPTLAESLNNLFAE